MAIGIGEVADMFTDRVIGLLLGTGMFGLPAIGNAEVMDGNGRKVTGDKKTFYLPCYKRIISL